MFIKSIEGRKRETKEHHKEQQQQAAESYKYSRY